MAGGTRFDHAQNQSIVQNAKCGQLSLISVSLISAFG